MKTRVGQKEKKNIHGEGRKGKRERRRERRREDEGTTTTNERKKRRRRRRSEEGRRKRERERENEDRTSGRERTGESSAYDLSSTTATTYMSHRTRSLGHWLGVVQTYQRHPRAVCLRPPFNKISRARSATFTPECHSFDHRDVPVSRLLLLSASPPPLSLVPVGYPSLSRAILRRVCFESALVSRRRGGTRATRDG